MFKIVTYKTLPIISCISSVLPTFRCIFAICVCIYICVFVYCLVCCPRYVYTIGDLSHIAVFRVLLSYGKMHWETSR